MYDHRCCNFQSQLMLHKLCNITSRVIIEKVMCFDKETCWDNEAGAPNYLNRDPPCQNEKWLVKGFFLSHAKLCNDDQFFTVANSVAQENDLMLYIQIYDLFSNWTLVSEQYNASMYPQILMDGYNSRKTNYQWKHFDGTQLEYFGLNNFHDPQSDPVVLSGPPDYPKLQFSTFFKAKVHGKNQQSFRSSQKLTLISRHNTIRTS